MAPNANDSALLLARREALWPALAEHLAQGAPRRAAEVLHQLLLVGEPAASPRLMDAAAEMIALAVAGGNGGEAVPTAGQLPFGVVRAACELGLAGEPLVRGALAFYAGRPELWLAGGRPWTISSALLALWAGRETEDVTAAVSRALSWAAERVGPDGSLFQRDRWAVIEALGEIQHPAARPVLERLVPMLIRCQWPDGGWRSEHGEHGHLALRALAAHGMLEPLRARPPLPADWHDETVLELPVGEPSGLLFADGLLWVLDASAKLLVAVDPADGGVARRLPLDSSREWLGLGGWGRQAALVAGGRGPRRICRVDLTAGVVREELVLGFCGPLVLGVVQHEDELLVADAAAGHVWAVNPRRPGLRRRLELPGAAPVPLCAEPGGLWWLDLGAPLLLLTAPDGRLIDWASPPVWGPLGRLGVAHDGRRLWALDPTGRRILGVSRRR